RAFSRGRITPVRSRTRSARLLARASDTPRGHHHLIEGQRAHRVVGDVVLRPESVEVQVRGVALLQIEHLGCGRRVIRALAAVCVFRAELVADPVAERTLVVEALYQRVVLPDLERGAGAARATRIEAQMRLEADPGLRVEREVVAMHEAVAVIR